MQSRRCGSSMDTLSWAPRGRHMQGTLREVMGLTETSRRLQHHHTEGSTKMNLQTCSLDTYAGHKTLCRCTHGYPPGHRIERIYLYWPKTHTLMKTDTGHPDTCAHKSHTYHEQCSQGCACTTHRCIHWHKDTYMQTWGTGVQKECGDIQRKTPRHTHRLHRRTQGQQERVHGERGTWRDAKVDTSTATLTDVQMVVHE